MAKTAPITVELSAKDRQLIRELIEAVRIAQEDVPAAEEGVKRLVEGQKSLWNDTGAIYWGDEPGKE